jgi:hypothetical protein
LGGVSWSDPARSITTRPPANGLFAWLISHQPAVLVSQNKPATSNQPTMLFSQNKSAPAISHQPNEHVANQKTRAEPLQGLARRWEGTTRVDSHNGEKPRPTAHLRPLGYTSLQ